LHIFEFIGANCIKLSDQVKKKKGMTKSILYTSNVVVLEISNTVYYLIYS